MTQPHTSAVAAGSGARDAARDRAWRIATWFAMAAFAAFRLPELTRYALWYDELFSLSLAQRGWGDLLAGAIADRTNPPLFYALLKAWMDVGGESVAWMRLLPCAFGILVAVPMVALARRVANAATAATAGPAAATPATGADNPMAAPFVVATVAVAAASPLAVFLSNELRAYSLLLLLSATWLLAYLRLSESAGWLAPGAGEGDAPSGRAQAAAEHRRRVAQLALVAVALVYAHYFGWLLVAATVATAVFWRRGTLTGVIVAAGVAGLAFLPWAVAVAINAARAARPLANVAWVAPPVPRDIPLFYDALVARVLTTDTAWVGALLLAALGAGLVLWLRRAPRGSLPRRVAAELGVLAVLPVLVAYTASHAAGQSVFVPRYLMIAAPAWWLIVALAAVALGSTTARRSTTARPRPVDLEAHRWAAAVTLAAFTLAAGALREMRGGEKIAWDRVVAAIAADAGPAGGTIYALEGFTALPARYYAATLETKLAVRPVRDLAGIAPPAWLVVRLAPGQAGPAPGAGLRVRGRSLTPIVADTIPSQVITAYRVGPR